MNNGNNAGHGHNQIHWQDYIDSFTVFVVVVVATTANVCYSSLSSLHFAVRIVYYFAITANSLANLINFKVIFSPFFSLSSFPFHSLAVVLSMFFASESTSLCHNAYALNHIANTLFPFHPSLLVHFSFRYPDYYWPMIDCQPWQFLCYGVCVCVFPFVNIVPLAKSNKYYVHWTKSMVIHWLPIRQEVAKLLVFLYVWWSGVTGHLLSIGGRAQIESAHGFQRKIRSTNKKNVANFSIQIVQ